MDVSVIIVNYNTKTITQNCINSIFDKTKRVSFEVIVVDNASTDGSKELFSSDNRVIYIYNKVNHGFGSANNIGAGRACGKYLLFLNSDTYLKNDSISLFYEYMEQCSDNIGFCGTVLLDEENNINGYGSSFPTMCNGIKSALHCHKKIQELPKLPFDIDYVLGACMFVNRVVFVDLKGFDEEFFMYYEESDLQYRAYKKGYINRIISGPKIVHLENGSVGVLPTHKKRMIVEKSHLMYLQKHSNHILFKCFVSVYFILKLLTFMSKRYSLKENYEYMSLIAGYIRC